MKSKSRTAGSEQRPKKRARSTTVGAVLATLFMLAAHAQHGPASVSGKWHVAVPGWGIEDHLLVVQEHDGTMAGKFEFADVKGTVTGAAVRFDVTDGGRLLIRFEGTISGDRMNGTATSPQDGPLVQHGLARDLTAEWTADREASPSH